MCLSHYVVGNGVWLTHLGVSTLKCMAHTLGCDFLTSRQVLGCWLKCGGPTALGCAFPTSGWVPRCIYPTLWWVLGCAQFIGVHLV